MKAYLKLLEEWRSHHDLTEEEETAYADELNRLWWAMDKAEQIEVVRILESTRNGHR